MNCNLFTAFLVLGAVWLVRDLYALESNPKSPDGKPGFDTYGGQPAPMQNSTPPSADSPGEKGSQSARFEEPKGDGNPKNPDDADDDNAQKKPQVNSQSFMGNFGMMDMFKLFKYFVSVMNSPNEDEPNPKIKGNYPWNPNGEDDDKDGRSDQSPTSKRNDTKGDPSGTARNSDQSKGLSTSTTLSPVLDNDSPEGLNCSSQEEMTTTGESAVTPEPLSKVREGKNDYKVSPMKFPKEKFPSSEFMDDYINRKPPMENQTPRSPDNQTQLNNNPMDNYVNDKNETLGNDGNRAPDLGLNNPSSNYTFPQRQTPYEVTPSPQNNQSSVPAMTQPIAWYSNPDPMPTLPPPKYNMSSNDGMPKGQYPFPPKEIQFNEEENCSNETTLDHPDETEKQTDDSNCDDSSSDEENDFDESDTDDEAEEDEDRITTESNRTESSTPLLQTSSPLPQTSQPLPQTPSPLPETSSPFTVDDVMISTTDVEGNNEEPPKVETYNSILEFLYRNSKNPIFTGLKDQQKETM